MHDNPQRGNHPLKDSCEDCMEPALELSVKTERIAALKHMRELLFYYS